MRLKLLHRVRLSTWQASPGEHQGLAFYTIGQRRGIRIAASEPYFVIDKDAQTNRLIVGYAKDAGNKHLQTARSNWISGLPPEEGGHTRHDPLPG